MSTFTELDFANGSLYWCKRQHFLKPLGSAMLKTLNFTLAIGNFFLDDCPMFLTNLVLSKHYLLPCLSLYLEDYYRKKKWEWEISDLLPPWCLLVESKVNLSTLCSRGNFKDGSTMRPCITQQCKLLCTRSLHCWAINPLTLVLFCLSLSADLMCHVSNKMFCSWRQSKRKHFLQGLPSDRGRPWLSSTSWLIDNSSLMKFSVSKKKLNVSDFIKGLIWNPQIPIVYATDFKILSRENRCINLQSENWCEG
jgi:hypothetical protein